MLVKLASSGSVTRSSGCRLANGVALRCCSVVQCVAVWCSVVQCVAVRCSVLRCVAARWIRAACATAVEALRMAWH